MALTLSASIIQMNVKNDAEDNIEKSREFLDKAAAQGSKFVILPELWLCGYAKNIREVARKYYDEVTSNLSEFAARHDLYIIGSIPTTRNGEGRETHVVYNTAHLIGPEGLVGTYDKAHLIRIMGEDKIFQPGNSWKVFHTKYADVGIVICYDLRFPGLTRVLTVNGAKMIFVPCAWPYPRIQAYRYLMVARAIENQLFMISANRTGEDEKFKYFGHSMVVDPTGEIILEADEHETLLTCRMNFSKMDEVRETLPCLKERKTELYKEFLD
jgi:predicted amidohydrolase